MKVQSDADEILELIAAAGSEVLKWGIVVTRPVEWSLRVDS